MLERLLKLIIITEMLHVNWEETQKRITTNLNTNTLNITQGFLSFR